MLIDISKIKVSDRIRKDFGDIEELAADIEKYGLINPVVITTNNELLAGERRLRAHQFLRMEQVEVRIMEIADYEHQLHLEISENVRRKEFTFSEQMEIAERIAQVERIKAKDRMAGKENFPEQTGQVRDIVAEKAGFGSGKQYDKAKFIAENATPDIIQQLDAGLISTHKAFIDTKERLEEEVREANERANMAEQEAVKLRRQYRDAVPRDQVEEAVAEAVERQQEENAAFIAQKEKEADAVLKQRDEHWKSQLKEQAEKDRINIEQLKSGYKSAKEEIEALKLQQPNDFDEKHAEAVLRKQRFEADISTAQLGAHVKQFLQKVGITTLMLGAVGVASSNEKKRMSDSLDMLQEFINQVRPAVNGRKVV